MAIDDAATRLEWRDFAELNTDLLYELLRLRQAVFVVEQRSPYADLDSRDQHAHHLLQWRDNELAGYLRLIPVPGKLRIALGRVVVAPEWRRQGLARLSVQAALDRCARDYPELAVTLSAQCYLVPFYESLGFRVTSDPYDDCGIPHADMALPKGP